MLHPEESETAINKNKMVFFCYVTCLLKLFLRLSCQIINLTIDVVYPITLFLLSIYFSALKTNLSFLEKKTYNTSKI